MRHRWPRGHARGASLLEPRIETPDKRGNLILCRLLFFLRRHLAGIDLLDNLGPMMGVCARSEITRKLVDPQVTLLLLRAVTADAISVQEGIKPLRCAGGTGKAEAGDEEGGEARTDLGQTMQFQAMKKGFRVVTLTRVAGGCLVP